MVMSSKAHVYLVTEGTRVTSDVLLDAVVLLSHVATLRTIGEALRVAFEGYPNGLENWLREPG